MRAVQNRLFAVLLVECSTMTQFSPALSRDVLSQTAVDTGAGALIVNCVWLHIHCANCGMELIWWTMISFNQSVLEQWPIFSCGCRVRESRLVHTFASASGQRRGFGAYTWPDQGNPQLLPWVLHYIIPCLLSIKKIGKRLINLPWFAAMSLCQGD